MLILHLRAQGERRDLPLPNLRQFAASTQAVDAAWSTSACSADVWNQTGTAWQTNNAPKQVANGSGMLGVQKPGRDNPDNPYTAATEKIVADLAHLLGLPIPPACLFDSGEGSTPRYVAISAWAYAAPLTWGQADALLTPVQKDSLRTEASAMIPFESWIAAEDRSNAGNVLVNVEANSDVHGAWIDYAFSLDHVWKGNQGAPCNVGGMYPPVGAPINEFVTEVAQRIVALTDDSIQRVVNRIPSEYLPTAVGGNIVRNLLDRRAIVRRLFP